MASSVFIGYFGGGAPFSWNGSTLTINGVLSVSSTAVTSTVPYVLSPYWSLAGLADGVAEFRNNAGAQLARIHATTASGSGGYDIGIGIDTFSALTTGEDNSAFGYRAQASIVDGSFNTAFGYRALQDNISGGSNTAFGQAALQSNTGSDNTGLGKLALQLNTSGTQNTAVGSRALATLDGGSYNVSVGYASLNNATTAARNVAIGRQSLLNVATGSYNVGVGYGSLQTLSLAGAQNVALGGEALGSTTGSGNNAIGYFAGFYATGSNELYVDNRDRTNNANEKAQALMYGVMAATAKAQTLAFNTGGTRIAAADTFANLPGTPAEGMLAVVTDSNTATWGATIAGSGANHVLAYYNGTNWTVAGK